MDDLTRLTARLETVERRFRWTLGALVFLSAIVSLAALRPPAEVLRARGLIITDAQGRPRVVLGAPLTDVLNDRKLARASGVVMLDSLGRLTVAVGTNTPLVFADGKVGDRNNGTENGYTIYDPRTGAERGGSAAFSNGQASNCLDYAVPKEAVCMSVAPGDGYAAMMVNGNPRVKAYDQAGVFVGQDGTGVLKVFGGGPNFGGISLKAGKGAPQIVVFDSSSKVTGDVLRGLAQPTAAP